MKTAILLHGKPSQEEYYSPDVPSLSNSHWFPWLQKQLLIHDIATQTPEIPNSWDPHYPTWSAELERYDITPETILVGHSCGGGFLVRWLSEHPEVRVGKVVLVAPWLDPDREDTTDFFDFTIDPTLADRTSGLTIFNSDNDYASIHKTVQILRDAIPDIAYREFHRYGHFTLTAMKTEPFPELRDELIQDYS
jgi:predicted alpha/beta hydrolase family esterase